jgi:hypothetical protein
MESNIPSKESSRPIMKLKECSNIEQVWRQVNRQLSTQIPGLIRDPVYNTSYNQVGERIYNHIWDSINGKVYEQIWDEVYASVWNIVSIDQL